MLPSHSGSWIIWKNADEKHIVRGLTYVEFLQHDRSSCTCLFLIGMVIIVFLSAPVSDVGHESAMRWCVCFPKNIH